MGARTAATEVCSAGCDLLRAAMAASSDLFCGLRLFRKGDLSVILCRLLDLPEMCSMRFPVIYDTPVSRNLYTYIQRCWTLFILLVIRLSRAMEPLEDHGLTSDNPCNSLSWR
jgi:hypothetical protein